MNIDRYTKTVLTVIAVCLIWISLGGPSLLTPVAAQNNVQDVAIVGWKQGTAAATTRNRVVEHKGKAGSRDDFSCRSLLFAVVWQYGTS